MTTTQVPFLEGERWVRCLGAEELIPGIGQEPASLSVLWAVVVLFLVQAMVERAGLGLAEGGVAGSSLSLDMAKRGKEWVA